MKRNAQPPRQSPPVSLRPRYSPAWRPQSPGKFRNVCRALQATPGQSGPTAPAILSTRSVLLALSYTVSDLCVCEGAKVFDNLTEERMLRRREFEVFNPGERSDLHQG